MFFNEFLDRYEKSFLTATSAGYMRFETEVYKDEDWEEKYPGYVAVYYDKNFKVTGRKIIPEELPEFGNFYETDNYYFIITGENNKEETEGKETIRITKYNKNWEKIKDCHFVNNDVVLPFRRDGGGCECALFGDILAIHGCYRGKDGHQRNFMIEVNVNSMESDMSLRHISSVSHSLNQFILNDNGIRVSVDHGDAYPSRSFILTVKNGESAVAHAFYPFSGETGANYTGAAAGDFTASDSSYLLSFQSVDQSKYEESLSDSLSYPYNVFIASYNKSSEKTEIKQITDFTENKRNTIGGMYLIPVANNRFMLLWTVLGMRTTCGDHQYYFDKSSIQYVFLDGEGNKTSPIHTYEETDWCMGLSGCHPVYENGCVTWYSWDDGIETLYRIPVSNPDPENIQKTVACRQHEWIGSDIGDINPKGSDNVLMHIPYEFKEKKFYEWQKTEDGYQCYRVEYSADNTDVIRKIKVDTESSVTKENYCMEDGIRTYRANILGDYFEEMEETIPKDEEKHKWQKITAIFWSPDYKTCKASRTCTYSADHFEEIDLDVSTEYKLPGDKEGWYYDKITATGTFPDGKTVTNTKKFQYTDTSYIWGGVGNIKQCVAQRQIIPIGKTKAQTELIELETEMTFDSRSCEQNGHIYYDAYGTFSNGTPVSTKDDGKTLVVETVAGTHYYDNGTVVSGNCTEPKKKVYHCLICGDEKDEILEDSAGHDYELIAEEPATCSKAGKKTYKCKVCENIKEEVIPKTDHLHTERRHQKEATCSESGYTGDVYCIDCGVLIYEGEDIPKTDHEWEEDYTTDRNPNCTEDGEESIHCKNCEAKKDSRPIKASGHDYRVQSSEDPTCTKAGKKVLKCSRCDDVREETIPATGHVHKVTRNKKEATCKEEGYSGDVYCSDCDTLILAGQTIPKKDHDYGSEVTPATCLTPGKEVFTCKNCGDTYSVDIPVTDEHEWALVREEKATCLEDGRKTMRCSVCKKEKTETIKATGHDWEEDPRTDREATCKEEGEQSIHCKNCDARKDVSPIPKADHSYKKEVVHEATCTESGSATYTCSVCGDSYSEEIKAKGHTPVKDARVEPTTAATGRTEGSHCSECGITLIPQNVIPKLNVNGDEKDPTSVASEEKKITSMKNDGDIKGSTFSILQLRANSVSKNTIRLTWTRVKNASGYIVYGNRCNAGGKRFSFVPIKDTRSTGLTLTKLAKGTYYKYMVIAYKTVRGSKKVLASSKAIHVATTGSKVGNYKKAKVNKRSVILKRGKTFKIKAKQIPANKKLKVKQHRKVCYESSNPNVAAVSKTGNIKAKKKGKCFVYVYTQSGTFTRIKVRVR